MCDVLRSGRTGGRRANVVLVAEGVGDLAGNAIDAAHVKEVLEERLGEDVRVTVLGHVQRGGAPSAFDRYLGTVLGHAAVRHLVTEPAGEPQVIGIRGHQLTTSPLRESVARTRSVADVIAAGDHETAMELRGGSFSDSFQLLRTLVQARPRRPEPGQRSARLAILHAGGPAPGMNAAVRVALRVGMNHGHTLLAVTDGFRGLIDAAIETIGWMTVSGWVSRPGADLGTSRHVPGLDDLDRIARNLVEHRIDGILLIGGWSGYVAAHRLQERSAEIDGLAVPIVCVPATINNDLPGTDMSIGADTALNNIVTDVDKIKQSAVAVHRCFVVEVMGHDCGYLTLMSALATGAERVYLPEEGITLRRIQDDLEVLRAGFALGKRQGLVIRGEHADPSYTTSLLQSLFSRESGGRFDVRSAVLGHVQQGGSPTPFDRILASRLAAAATEELIARVLRGDPAGTMVGLRAGQIELTPLAAFPDLLEPGAQRTRGPAWWTALRPLVDLMGQAEPP